MRSVISWTALGSVRALGAVGCRRRNRPPACLWSPGPRGPGTGSVVLDDPGLGLDHLPATVVAVGGHVVAQVGLARGRVGGQLLGRQRVVRTTHATTGRGDAGLLHCHGIAPGSIRLLRLLGGAMTARGVISVGPALSATPARTAAARPRALRTVWASRAGPLPCAVPPGPPEWRGSVRPRPVPVAASRRLPGPAALRNPAAARPRPP